MIIKLKLHWMIVWLTVLALPCRAIDYPGDPAPGAAQLHVSGNSVTLENDVIAMTFDITSGAVQNIHIDDKTITTDTPVQINEPFILRIGSADVPASGLTVSGPVQAETLAADPAALCLGERFDAKAVAVSYAAPDNSYSVDWKAILRDGSNYVLFEVTVTALTGDVDLTQLTLLDAAAENPQVAGTAAGSPVTAENFFLGFHYPTAVYAIKGSNVRAYWNRAHSLISQGGQMTMHAAVGTVPPNQLQRGFSYYLNRERAQAYRHFLHYNSWYDIAHSDRSAKFTEAECLDRIQKFGQELTNERGLSLKTYAWDDPWDNISGAATDVWQFDSIRHPNQWLTMKSAAAAHGAAMGAWMSPRGGYGGFLGIRINTASANGLPYDTSGGIFKLSDTSYFNRYRDVAIEMLNNQGVNYFKFDGFTSGQDAERERLFNLIDELRVIRPDLFINTTVGSWGSPYFLMYSDSIWRQGGDIGTAGSGTTRRQWITYRDGQTYNNIVRPNPLFPINSLMLHGVVLARYAHISGLRTATPEEFKQEVRSYFAFGVNLQELYIGPDDPETGQPIMTEQLWDILAEAALWASVNEDVLADSHWIGGNPNNGQIYGAASWNRNKAVMMLRNPAASAKSITLDPEDIFALPSSAAVRQFVMKSPWAEDAAETPLILKAGTAHRFDLAPYEVLVLQSSRGDLTGDGDVTLDDFAAFSLHWLETGIF